MSKPHVCGDNWTRVHRMMLALTLWDDGLYKLVMAEIQDCPSCLKGALEICLHQYANSYALHAGSLASAADHLVDELERLLMPSQKTDDRMAELDRQNRRTKTENHNRTTE
jgi:hypothetical protein